MTLGRKLYHFTCPTRIDSILSEGIWKGDVPITPTTGFNAPWLTENSDPGEQDWTMDGTKSQCRIEVFIPDDELHRLKKWTDVCVEYDVPIGWREILNRTGGGGEDEWYIFEGAINKNWLGEIEQWFSANRSCAGSYP